MPPTASNPPPADETNDFRALIGPLWEQRLLILALYLIATIATYVYYDREPDVFESDTVLYIAGGTDTNSTLSGLPIAPGTDRNVQNQSRLLKTTDVARNVARRLNFGGDPSALLKSVNSSFESGQDFLTISATSGDRRRAADIANAFAAAFLELRTAQTRSAVQRALKVAREQLTRLGAAARNAPQRTTLQQTVSRLEAAASTGTGSVRQLDPAAAPGKPVSPKPKRSALFAFAIALALGVGVAYFLDRLDRRLRTIDVIADTYGVPLVSVIPHAESATPLDAGGPVLDPAFRESFRGLHTNVRLLTLDKPARSLVVASAIPGEGKSTVARNLGLIYREWGLRVLLVETDLRRPVLAEMLGVVPQFGLTHVLTGMASLAQATCPVKVKMHDVETLLAVSAGPKPAANGASGERNGASADIGALHLLAAGREPANPQAVLASTRMAELFTELETAYDMVIADSSPLLAVSDGLPLLSLADTTIIVARMGQSTREAAKRMLQIVGRLPGANILGVVVNDAPNRTDSTTYGYGYGYGYSDPSNSSRAGRGAVEREGTLA